MHPFLPPPPHQVTRYDKAGKPFNVRPFAEADRAGLQAFYLDFEPKRTAQGLPPASAERIHHWLATVLPHGVHLLTWRGETLIGHALVIPLPQPGVAEYAVFLHQDERGKGVGTALNRVAIDAAREAGLSRLWLSVEPHNRAALRSYEKVGFRFRPTTIYGPEAEMTLDL